MAHTEQNYYQALTTPGKLRGQYYTPDALVGMILDALPLAAGDLILDPSCGDGSFLRGAVAALARRFPETEPQALAAEWARRLVGFDVDADAVSQARESLREAFRRHLGVDLPAEQFCVWQADVLAHPALASLLETAGASCGSAALERLALAAQARHSVNTSSPSASAPIEDGCRLFVIGNPPYVEAKRLARETSAALKQRFPEAVAGAPDLYLYFLHVCLGWLRPQDTLAFVLPNKLLVNANAQPLRERLLAERRLQALWLATETGIFAGAAVYPVVLFAGGPGPEPAPRVEIVRIARTTAGELGAGECVAANPSGYSRTGARTFFPWPASPALWESLEILLSSGPEQRLDAVLDIRWTVSFHRTGLRERYVTPERPEGGCARRFLGGGPFTGNGEVSRYRLRWAGWWIRYDTAALKAERNPLPHPAMFERPKLVICQNGRTLRAAYDEAGFILKDTFLCGCLRERDHPLCRHPRALVGLLCSRAVHFFYSHVFYGGHVNVGYLHFLPSFLVDIPVGDWSEAAAADVAALVRARETAPRAEWEALEEQIEAHVSAGLGLSEAQQAAIAAWAAGDANWQARERVRLPSSRTGK